MLMTAKKQEVLGLQKNKDLLSQLSSFQTLLDEVYGSTRPSIDDYANRRDLIRIFNDIAREMYGNEECPVVEDFGSFLMNMFDAKSDLDLSINFNDQLFEADRIAKIKTLRKFAKKFYALRKKGCVTTVELIMSARVPVLKVTDSGSGIECDFSVGNRDGIAKSHIIFLISAIDERFQKLSFMLKAWAKAQDINSSKDGTLNSLSLILLAAFHLQTRDIPILPPFSDILKDGTDPEAVKKIIPRFLKYGKRNKESLAELFVSLLVKIESVESLWSKGICVSTFEGAWIYKNWKATGLIRIEDFTDRSQNTARAVRSAKITKIYSCIRRSVEQIQLFTKGIISADNLKSLLFGKVPPQTKKIIATACDSNLSKSVPQKRKKKCPTQGAPAEEQRPGKQGFIADRTHVETLRDASPKYPPRQPISFSGYGGFRPERNHEIMKYADSIFPQHQLPSHSNQHIQGHSGFRSERTHVHNVGHAPNFLAGPFSVFNPPVQGFGRYIHDRMHVDTPIYSGSMSRPHPLANLAAGFGHEAQAETIYHPATSFQTSVPYTSSYRPSSSAMPPHQPYIPTAPYPDPAGLQRSHDTRHSFPHVSYHPYQL
ncbi:protein HESO1-like isoform X2 [Chenopodium quinoa]|uniref:protein HESO1-like isoform X2 n=1 Tax=Chenopodium quinoa TaxID=63459 RepID=UPI000B77AB3C|nr:protein HESO1-like isoform X2 [Chenopodium quinoa]